ncbi:nickel transporter permease [Brevibacillus centrosporus]|uniref:Peptide/nickel transport system permease protein n=1 Tax=Brevibacillus centrosporus TaxID=54910 RepID=A0A1I3ZWN9_9BACL|nr:nickel transporter permease [Brevibacillus centrosporus]MEC2131799.1 ABC transporter permease [Brevibacillus centrosporus]MED4908509.1 ABC transporter permease [Brevibacillus centrosporus]RNB67439.1 ABC transporter permease [Brevibacillus centrosporus]SFK47949.1 peptide/nickel transport system permease protein [Brevibacillus centrosporus]GED33621.1 peptide ABC transporter permease [Brevibacillus centrosporus]
MSDTDVSVQVATQAAEVSYQRRSPWASMLRRFRKNKRALVGFWMVVVFVGIAVFAQAIAPYDPIEQNMDVILQPPSADHLFGTDEYGRDILSRIIYGSQISLMIGIVGVLISVVIGVGLGTVSGYFGGRTDMFIMRIMDIFMAFPSFLLALAIVSVLGPGMVNVMIAIGIFSVPTFARISRSAVISVKNKEFIEAAKSMGASHARVIFKHVLPNSVAPIIVLSTMRIATAILTASGLSFLGMGAQPPTPEWGAMLSTGREYLRTAPHVSTIPGLAIMFMVLAFNMLGDGLRDALDPKMKL